MSGFYTVKPRLIRTELIQNPKLLCTHHSKMMECADLHFVYSCKVESDVSLIESHTDADLSSGSVFINLQLQVKTRHDAENA